MKTEEYLKQEYDIQKIEDGLAHTQNGADYIEMYMLKYWMESYAQHKCEEKDQRIAVLWKALANCISTLKSLGSAHWSVVVEGEKTLNQITQEK